MIDTIKKWNGTIEVNGVVTDPVQLDFKGVTTPIRILLHPSVQKPVREVERPQIDIPTGQFKVTVKKYMTEKSSPRFDFMEKWNNNRPMPLRTMVGEKTKETNGMVYMILHGDIYAERVCTCMKCGRPITNPVSQFFGMGPECGGHNYTNPFDTDEELRQSVEKYRAQLRDIVWEGWIIKSAITEMEVIE